MAFLFFFLLLVGGYLLKKLLHKKESPPQPNTQTQQTVIINNLSNLIHLSLPPKSIFNTLAYTQANFITFSKDFDSDAQKVLFLAEKLIDHYYYSKRKEVPPPETQD
ncbi:hypothetical protein DSO57_1012981 [Entomophthora muscae]|uniref:Uncharacterized protein n=1 Tax=Entomophthora muscae TaxID=34485 RepID=A0ACC2UFA2_9FUNG|nr:hypothetical protein DSO57_1012981 [Entomophthora muscae]